MKLAGGGAGAFRKDQHAKTFTNPLHAGFNHRIRIKGPAGSLEKASVLQQGTQPVSAKDLGFHGRDHVLECRDRARDIAERGVIGDKHRGAVWQSAAEGTGVIVEEADGAQRVVHERKRTTHDPLQHPRACLGILRAKHVQQHERAIAERSREEVGAYDAHNERKAHGLSYQRIPPAGWDRPGGHEVASDNACVSILHPRRTHYIGALYPIVGPFASWAGGSLSRAASDSRSCTD